MIRKRSILVFAGVALLLLLDVGAYLIVCHWLAASPEKPWQVITVEAIYPGANAQEIENAVAVPLEGQINGVEKMRYMKSQCGSDGRYVLDVVFEPDVDINLAMVLVQERANLAVPILPGAVLPYVMTVTNTSPKLVMVMSLFSPDGSRDAPYLSNYTSTHIKNELCRIPGVGPVTCLSQPDLNMCVWLDLEKMTDCNLTVSDVVQAIDQQVTQAKVSRIKQSFERNQEFLITPINSDRLLDVGQLENILLKSNSEGQILRLRDVSRIKLEKSSPQKLIRLNGKPAVALCIYPMPWVGLRELRAALLDKLSQLRKQIPEGVAIDVTCDIIPKLENPNQPTIPDFLLVEVDLPTNTSPERGLAVLTRCETLLREVEGVTDVLSLPQQPLSNPWNRDCIYILVRLAPENERKSSRQQLAESIRDRLGQVEEITPRLCDPLGAGRCQLAGYPIELAIIDPEKEKTRILADKLVQRLRESNKLTDLWSTPGCTAPQLCVDIDRFKMKDMGLAMDEVFKTLRVIDSNHFGRALRVRLQSEKVEDVMRLKIRNAGGQVISLSAVATVRLEEVPVVLSRFNGLPAVEITANPASGVSLTEAQSLCENLSEDLRKEFGLSPEYYLTWLPGRHKRK